MSQNAWHQVTVTVIGAALSWTNAAGATWGLGVLDGRLFTGEDCPCGVSEIGVILQDDDVSERMVGGEAYMRPPSMN